MPTAVGPNTKGEENLIFGFDLKDTQNSYKGEPTENLITNPRPTSTTGFSRSGGTGTITYDSEKQAVYWEQTAYATWGAYINFYPAFTGTLDTNSQYTFSIEYYSESEFAETGINYNLVQGNGQSGATYYNNITPKVVEVGGGWKRFTHTFTPANSGVSAAYNRFIVGSKGTNVLRLWFRNIQFEKKSKRTPFTAGTRSATQGLVDLTGNTTIDLTNVSFDSNAQMTFDGTNDHIQLADGTKWFTDEWAYEMVVKFNGNTGTYQGLVWGEGAVQSGYSGYQKLFSFYNYQYFHYRVGNSTTGWNNTNYTPSNFAPGNYNHIVWQFSNGTTNIAINGEIVHTDTSRGSYNAGTNSPLFIGCRNDLWGDFNGDMPYLKRYSRVLTASEIKANYNAIKGRFNT